LVDSNSLTPWGPPSKQNQVVLFYFNNFASFCKRLKKLPPRTIRIFDTPPIDASEAECPSALLNTNLIG